MTQELPTLAQENLWTPIRSAAGDRNPWLITMVVSIATFMEILDTSIANVALRNIAGSMGAGGDESTWVITTYLVANAIILPISGWLSAVMGRKRFYMICVATFTLSSLCCGLSTSLPMLLFFRVLQGLGGGGLAPCEQAILADTFPPAKRAMAFSVYGVVCVVSPVLGPPLGGWITDTYSWRWIFLINIPVGILSLLLCGWLVKEPPILVQERKSAIAGGLKLDGIGFGLAALGLACIEVMNAKGERLDWFESPLVRAMGLTALVALVTMVIWEWRRKDPVVDVKLFKNRSFTISFIMMFVTGFVLYGSSTVLPMLLQGPHGYTSTLAGMVLMPGGIATFLCMPLVAYFTRLVPLRRIVLFGFLTQALALYYMSGFAPDLSFNHAVVTRIGQTAFIGAIFVPIMTLSYHGLDAGKSSAAAALINIARNFGGSFGIAMANTWLAQRAQFHHHRLIERLSLYNPQFNQTAGELGGFLESLGADPLGAAQKSLAMLYQSLNLQAYLKAFNDLFLIMALICALCILLVPLLPNIKGSGEVSGH